MKKIGLFYLITLFSLNVGASAISIDLTQHKLELNQILLIATEKDQVVDPNVLSESAYASCYYVDADKVIPNRDAEEAKSIIGCVFSDKVAMNSALLRPGLYVHTKQASIDDKTVFGSQLMRAVGGHDFDGKSLVDYFSTVEFQPAGEYLVNREIEKQFNNQVLDKIIASYNDNFIFYAVMNVKSYRENTSHELLHAQFYSSTAIRKALSDIWHKQVVEEDKVIITNALASGGYDVSQEELLYREFYSYFMQENAANYMQNIAPLVPLVALVPKYHKLISDTLITAKLRPLTLP